jgi:peptidoglycan/xylan/chitin deacetylase (PgdA/CDA1 family)
VNQVRAGRSLAAQDERLRWPERATVAVLLSFDSDHETLALRDGETSPGRMAQGEFGARVAVPRILDLLARHGVPATFFMPAVCALLRPEEARSYVSAGHEVGVHGWIHERNTMLSHEAEFDLVSRSIRVFEDQLGMRPTGIRTPSWDFSPHTLEVVRALGFDYDSSLMADTEPYELLEQGERTGVIEIPVEWIRDDAPYFVMDRYAGLRPQIAPRDILQIWIDEFDAARAEHGLFQLTLHPHIIGHRSRLRIVDELLSHILSFDDVWVGTHADLAQHVRAAL